MCNCQLATFLSLWPAEIGSVALSLHAFLVKVGGRGTTTPGKVCRAKHHVALTAAWPLGVDQRLYIRSLVHERLACSKQRCPATCKTKPWQLSTLTFSPPLIATSETNSLDCRAEQCADADGGRDCCPCTLDCVAVDHCFRLHNWACLHQSKAGLHGSICQCCSAVCSTAQS